MSARIAPEPVTISVTQAAQYAPPQAQSPRPVESAGSASADPGRDQAFGRKFSDGNEARQGDRPPGKDPSMLPQALFDAALIAEQYKPSTKPVQPADTDPQTEVASNEIKADDNIGQSVSENENAAARAETPAPSNLPEPAEDAPKVQISA